jgi:hypothetical protein
MFDKCRLKPHTQGPKQLGLLDLPADENMKVVEITNKTGTSSDHKRETLLSRPAILRLSRDQPSD